MRSKKILAAALSLLTITGTALASAPAAAPKDKELVKLSKDAKKMAEAQQKFASTCAACHGQQGQGLVGPNLTDSFWLKGNKPAEIYTSVANGNPAKGMPAMGPLVGGEENLKLLSAYVLTLKGKNVPGKGPEGKELK